MKHLLIYGNCQDQPPKSVIFECLNFNKLKLHKTNESDSPLIIDYLYCAFRIFLISNLF